MPKEVQEYYDDIIRSTSSLEVKRKCVCHKTNCVTTPESNSFNLNTRLRIVVWELHVICNC